MSNKLSDLLYNTMLSVDPDTLTVEMLEIVKERYSPTDLGEKFFSQLSKLAAEITNTSTKAAIIEQMIQSDEFDYNYETLDEYLTLVSDYVSNEENITGVLRAYTVSNLFKPQIFMKLAQTLDKQHALKILVMVREEDWGDLPAEYQEFAEEVRQATMLQSRIAYIAQFLYFVQPAYNKYAFTFQLTARYHSYEAAVNDWAWILPISTQSIVRSKIVTPQEAQVFLQLGNLIFNKGTRLQPDEQKALYSAFFADKDPIDVIFYLPK